MGDTALRKARELIPLKRAFELKAKGLSYQEVADILGVSKSGVYDALEDWKVYLDNPERGELFRENEGKILDALSDKIISTLPNDLNIKKGEPGWMSPYQRVGMFALLFDKRRLFYGQSTVNMNSLSALVVGAAKDFTKGKEVDITPDLPPNEAIAGRSESDPASGINRESDPPRIAPAEGKPGK